MNLYRNLLRFNDLWGRHGVWCRRSDEKKQIKREGGAHSTVTPRAKVILYRCPMIYGDGMVCGDGAAMLRAQNAGEHGWAARRKSRPGGKRGAHSTVTPRAKVILYRCPMIYGDGMVCGTAHLRDSGKIWKLDIYLSRRGTSGIRGTQIQL